MSTPPFPKPAARRGRAAGTEPSGPSPEPAAHATVRPAKSRDGRQPFRKPKSSTAFSRQPAPPDLPPSAPRQPGRETPVPAEVPLLTGIMPVLELLESDPRRIDAVFLRKGRHNADMDRIMDVCRAAGVRFSLLDAQGFSRIYAGKSQGVAARLYGAGFAELETLLDQAMGAPLPLVLALDQVQDPGNAGTLARTLYALGGAGLIVPRHNGAYLGAAASRAGAGALERLPVAKVANLGQALDTAAGLGFTIYGSAASPKETLEQTRDGKTPGPIPVENVFAFGLRFPAVLALGGEEGGLRPGIAKRCRVLLGIPMPRDFDSLNVAQAGGILTAWFLRHRQAEEGRT